MALSPKLLQVLKDMGQADLQVLASELVPAIEAEVDVLFPTAAVFLDGVEAEFNPVLQGALTSLVGKVQL